MCSRSCAADQAQAERAAAEQITLAAAIEQVLKEQKKPALYKGLTDTIVKRKIYVTKSNNLLSTVAVTLKRDKRFKKVKPGLYALRKAA